MIQHFFIEGKYYGRSPRSLVQTDRDSFGRPLSKLFYCAVCGDTFARCPITPETTWHAVVGCCRHCRPASGTHVPGSLWHWEVDFVAAFPDAVLRWEFDRHLEWFDREQTI